MITKTLDDNTISFIPEESDDLLTIRRLIKKGDKIGELIISESEDDSKTVPIYANENVKKVNFFTSLFMSFNYMIWGDV